MKVSSGSVGCEVRATSGERLSHCDPAQVVSLLKDHGWVFFSGLQPTVSEFEAFTGQFGTCAETRTVHYPPDGQALGFHAEDAYNPYRPDSIWFLCLYEGSDGGAPTGAVDGVRVLDDMGPEWRHFCRTHHLFFERQWPASTWQDALGAGARPELESVLSGIAGVTHRFLDDGALYVGYETPMVVRTSTGDETFSNTLLQAVTEYAFYGMSLSDGSPIPDELVHRAHGLAVQHEHKLGWRSGDVVVIDNLRMLHRRGEYSGRDRDLRARHCEDLFGTILPAAATPVARWTKRLLQGDEGYPVRVGPVTP